MRVLGQGGDGGTVDIGFACLSGMFERNDDVLYVCYDNEGYMNTGVQRSGATPPAARTATTEAVGDEPGNVFGQGKSAPLIALAHEIPYVATATIADLHDLEAKVEKAMGMRGARYLHVLVTCPLGWGSRRVRLASRIARLATQTGLFPVFEGERGDVTAVTKIRHLAPVEDYLRPQKRFRHLFEPERARRRHRPHPGARRPQPPTLRTAAMNKPFAITLDVGSSLANKTGSWRTERPVYVRNTAPCAGACPAGEDPQAWLYAAEEGDYETAWRDDHGGQPAARDHGPRLLPPVRDGLQPRAARRGGRHQLGRALPRRRGDPQRLDASRSTAPPTGKRVLVVGAGPSGLSAAYHLARLGHTVEIHEAGPYAGGMMRFGIPRYRLPREILDAEVQRILDLGVTLQLNTQGRRPRRRCAGFDAVFVAVGAHLGKRAYIPAGSAAKMLDAVALLRGMEGEDAPQLGRRVAVYGGGNTAFDAARTAKRLGAEEAVVVYRRTRDRMPAHDSELEEALAEGVTVKWLSTDPPRRRRPAA